MAPVSPWSPEMIVQLLRLNAMAEADPKITFNVMAARLNEAFGTNFSRNAVAGRLKTLRGETRSGEARQPRAAKRKPTPPPQRSPAHKADRLFAAPKLAARIAEATEPGASAYVTLLDREPWQCRWPVNDGGPFLFCGARKGDHDPTYCQHHRGVATGRSWRRSAEAAS